MQLSQLPLLVNTVSIIKSEVCSIVFICLCIPFNVPVILQWESTIKSSCALYFFAAVF